MFGFNLLSLNYDNFADIDIKFIIWQHHLDGSEP